MIVISLYGMLLAPMSLLPRSYLFALNTLVSVKRMENYFAESEYTASQESIEDDHLEILSGVYTYPTAPSKTEEVSARKPFELRLPNISLPQAGLVLITGTSGSKSSSQLLLRCAELYLGGKSSLLAALLGEMISKDGGVKAPARPDALAYCL